MRRIDTILYFRLDGAGAAGSANAKPPMIKKHGGGTAANQVKLNALLGLLNHGAQGNAQSDILHTPLHYALPCLALPSWYYTESG